VNVDIESGSKSKKFNSAIIRRGAGHERGPERQGVNRHERGPERQGANKRSWSIGMSNNFIITMKGGDTFNGSVVQASKSPRIPHIQLPRITPIQLPPSKADVVNMETVEVQFGPWGNKRSRSKFQKVECGTEVFYGETVTCLDILTMLVDNKLKPPVN